MGIGSRIKRHREHSPAESPKSAPKKIVKPLSESPFQQLHRPLKVKEEEKELSISVYEQAISLMERILNRKELKLLDEVENIHKVVEGIVDRVSLNDSTLIALTQRSSPSDYLKFHSVNVSILTVHLALSVGYSREKLIEIGIAALLHDIGMIEYKEVWNRAVKLSSKELSEIRKHALAGMQALQRVEKFEGNIARAAYQHHERVNRNGYPEGIDNSEIDKSVQMLAVVSVYSALIHDRLYRVKIIPYEAMKTIINLSGTDFEPQMVKSFVQCMSLYPVGSYVQLNNGEIGRVVRSNPGYLTRPVVNILFSPDGSRVKKVETVNLKEKPVLYIQKPLYDKELDAESLDSF